MLPDRYDPNDPRHRSWINIGGDSDFPLQNLPFGVFESPGCGSRAGVAIGDQALDLHELCSLGYLDQTGVAGADVFAQPTLNSFLRLGRPVWRAVRRRLSWLLNAANPELRDHAEHRGRVLLDRSSLRMRLPVEVGDFVDFYSSLEHATNVGRLFRPDNPLPPNWKHLPIGYHGRTSTLIPAGESVRRPNGQINLSGQQAEFTASRRLDFELEVGFIVGRDTTKGESLSTAQAEEFIFGLVLVNDWSARDIQQWEYVPLGPFLGKSFATSLSPWVVTLDALEPFRVSGPTQDPPPLPYLRCDGPGNFDLQLEVWLQPQAHEPARIALTNFRHMYWNMKQQLAHLTSNGTRLRAGDLCASGTVSGPDPGSYGSLLELTQSGQEPLGLASGIERTFLEDHDTVILRGYGLKNGVRVGFGDLNGTVLPAR